MCQLWRYINSGMLVYFIVDYFLLFHLYFGVYMAVFIGFLVIFLALATRWDGSLPLQCLWSLLQNEWPKPTPH